VYQGEELMKKLEDARQKVMNQMIENKILYSQAKKEGIEATEEDLDEELADMKGKFASSDEFNQALEREDMTLGQLRKQCKEQVMTRKLIRKNIATKIVVSPVEASDYYEAHKSEFAEPEKVRVRHILIRIQEDRPAEAAAARAEMAHQAIVEGKDFAETAKEYSDGSERENGGDMGIVPRGELRPAFEEVVFNLEPGAVTEVLQSPIGYHIFKVEEKFPEQQREFSEVRQMIEGRLFNQKIDQEVRGWIDTLRKNAYISFR
jgi:parvulin-like peptidyl-prolyl isomerase